MPLTLISVGHYRWLASPPKNKGLTVSKYSFLSMGIKARSCFWGLDHSPSVLALLFLV